MKRSYSFEWYPTKDTKYGKTPIHRTCTILLSNPLGETEIDAKAALAIFMRSFGNLRKNTIVKIKEFGENGQIGEDIVPSDVEGAIIPERKALV